MSATAAVQRLLTLVPWLLERPGAHVDEAAAAVGVDRETVLADLSLLDFCGLPGRLGGDLFETQLVGDRILLQLAPAFDKPLRPTPDEALRLVLSLDHVASVLGDELPGLRDAVTALRAAAGVPDGVRVVEEGTTAHLGVVRDALESRRAVSLRYRGRADAEPRDRHVDPWELLLHRGVWYLRAHDHGPGQLRSFRIDRITELRTLDTPVTVPRPAGELPEPTYLPGPHHLTVELQIQPRGHWVLDAVDAEQVEHGLDGVTRAVVRTDAPAWLVSLVLAARGHIIVTSPPSVRQAVARAARDGIAAHHTMPPNEFTVLG
jgi:proteasome accessory factor C